MRIARDQELDQVSPEVVILSPARADEVECATQISRGLGGDHDWLVITGELARI
jgi:hypothetical protein